MPNVQIGVYPTVEACMNLARATSNDMLRSSAGQILTDNAPFSLEFVNAAVDTCQEYLANNGVTTQIVDNVILTPIPPTPGTDPSIQVFIGYQGYNDGVNQHATPTLPPDLIVPLRIWQRQTNTGQQFFPVHEAKDGLQSYQPGSNFRQWEWRQGSIYMQGCTNTQDLRIRYEQSLLDFGTSTNFLQATILIPRSKRAVAYLILYHYAISRGSPQAPTIMQMAEEAMNQIINRHVRADQRNPSRPRGFRSGHGSIDDSLSGSYR